MKEHYGRTLSFLLKLLLVTILLGALAYALIFILNSEAWFYAFMIVCGIAVIEILLIWSYLGMYLAAKYDKSPAIWGLLFLFFGIWALLGFAICISIGGSDHTKSDFTTVGKEEKINTADELLKFKTLLDQGVITQEEFEKKKAELLK